MADLTWAAVDLAIYRDHAAVAVGQWHDGNAHVRVRDFVPEGGRIDILKLADFVRGVAEAYDLVECAYDPRYFEVEAQRLLEDQVPMLELTQHPSRMIPAYQDAYQLLVARHVIHGGDPDLTTHVYAAERRQTEDGWMLSKGRSAEPIDMCVATCILLHRMQAPVEPQRRAPKMW